LVRAIDLQLKFDRKSFAFLAADDSYGNPLVEAAAKKTCAARDPPDRIEGG
jgi:hypothetical protein